QHAQLAAPDEERGAEVADVKQCHGSGAPWPGLASGHARRPAWHDRGLGDRPVWDSSEALVELTGVGLGRVGTPHLYDCAVLRCPEPRICTNALFLRTLKCAFV